MNLFKRLLLSLFPEQFGGTLGPANMFLGLVNAKHFFTVITKKMVENPKLNLFDIGLDPVEVKIGFGDQANIKPKDLELYFSYCICANINGYTFFNSTNIGTVMSIALSQYFVADFSRNKKGTDMFMVLLIAINIVGYVFAARVKIFPNFGNQEDSKKESFNRFVTVFFNYYEFLLGMYNVKVAKKTLQETKAKLLAHADIFFGLYYMYQKLNTCFDDGSLGPDEYLSWLFNDELKKTKLKTHFKRYQSQRLQLATSPELSDMEDVLLEAIMPAEILVKLLFNREDVFVIAEHVVPKIYDPVSMDEYLHGFLTGNQDIESWTEYLMDHKKWKNNFFSSLQKMVMMKFNKPNMTMDEDDIEEMLSGISDGSGSFVLPESMRKEGILMDRVLNFYVGLMGSFWIGRGDSMYFRLFRPGLLSSLLSGIGVAQSLSIDYYSKILYQYTKNAFFYRTIFEGVRSGKASFMLPYVADVKETHNNITILKHFDENAVAVIFQDLLSKDISLSIHQQSIIDRFQSQCGSQIGEMVKYNTNTLIEVLYQPLDNLLIKPVVIPSLIAYTKQQDIKNLKECLYTLEFRIMQDLVKALRDLDLKSAYTDSVIFNIIASLKDTLVGLLFLMHDALHKQQDKKIDLKLHNMLHIYIGDILNIAPQYVEPMSAIILGLYSSYHEIIHLRTKIDDNQYFIDVGTDCWTIFVNKEKSYTISAEDALRFRGYLKHVTYYNKRYIKPKI